MPRFVILRHSTPAHYVRPLHFDFLLEEAAACRTWALSKEPVAGEVMQAEQLPPHRTMYLEYEGPLEGDRGEVIRWDAGQFEWLLDSSLKVQVEIRGTRLRGTMVLTRTSEQNNQWQCAYDAVP